MADFIEPNKLSLIGIEITTTGYVLAAIAEKKLLNSEDPLEVTKLSVLAFFLIFIGDSIVLKSVLLENRDFCKNQGVLDEAQSLGTQAAWFYIIADLTALRANILELQKLINKK